MDPTEELVKRLMAAMNCSVCDSHYDREGVEVLGHQEDLWFLSVTCPRCHTQGLVAAMVREATPDEAFAAREASITARELDIEAPSPRKQEQVDSDDLLNLHLFLEHFDGDFHRLFRDE